MLMIPGVRGLKFGLSLHLHPYFVYKNSEGSGNNVKSTKIWCAGSYGF